MNCSVVAARLLIAATLSIIAMACGQPPSVEDGGPDAGRSVADGGRDGGSGPTPIMAVAPPILTPCPSGWRTLSTTPPTCDPWPEGGRQDCPAGSAHFPGEPACAPLGTPCPDGGFSDELPEGTLYVRPGAVGDGSRSAPLGDIDEAVRLAPAGGTIALSPGTHLLHEALRRPMHLVGACMQTLIEGTVEVQGADSSVSNLRVIGENAGIRTFGGNVALHSLDIEAVTTGLELYAESIVRISEVRVEANTVCISSSGELSVERAFLVAHEGALEAVGPSQLRDISVLTTEPIADLSAVIAASYEPVVLQRFIIEGQSSPTVTSLGAAISLSDGVLRGPPSSERIPGPALLGFVDASFDLSRVLIERARTLAVALQAGSAIRARDLLILDVLEGSDIATGTGFEISDGSSADLERVALEGAVSLGIVVDSSTAHVRLVDVRIESILPEHDGTFGRAIQVQGGASLSGERIAIEACHELGIVCTGEGSNLDLVDLQLRDTRQRTCTAEGCPGAGIGVGTYLGGSTTLSRFLIDQSALAGVQVAFDGSLDLNDGVISRAPIGANVQVEGYDLSRLGQGVFYRDNGTNLESSMLEVPQPVRP